MPTLAELAHNLGPMLLDDDVVDLGGEVDDLCLATPSGPVQAGDLVLAVWVRTGREAAEAIGLAGRSGAAGVVVDVGLDEDLRQTARRERVGLASKAVSVSWADLFRATQATLADSGSAADGVDDALPSLAGLADRAAILLEGPITIEDDRAQVVAHSLDQHDADAARSTSILQRAAPPERMNHYRLMGLYDALADGADQVLVPGDDVRRTRVVLPVLTEKPEARRGVLPEADEPKGLAGTVWILRDQPLPDVGLAAAQPLLATIARQLESVRPQRSPSTAAIARALRAVINHAPATAPLDLGEPPWVVGIIGSGARSQEAQLTLWHGLLRRRGWRDPLLTTLDAGVVCVLREHGSGPGTLTWWQEQVSEALIDATSWVVVGSRAMSVAELRRSHDDAHELGRIGRVWPELIGEVLHHEERWAEVTVLRLLDRRTPPPEWDSGPMPALLQLPDFLLKTLWHYLTEDASIPPTAEKLQIHPNTLRYRLGKLGQAGADLERPIARQALHLQLLGLRFEGRLDLS